MKNKNTDEIIDILLAKQSAETSDDFMNNFQARLDAEKQQDANIDAILKRQCLHASIAFTDGVMRKIRFIKITNLLKPALPIFAAAASVALVFTIFTKSAKTPFDENKIFNELYQLDSQMASFDSFEELSMSYNASTSAAIIAFFENDI
jgi:hypothetical protein